MIGIDEQVEISKETDDIDLYNIVGEIEKDLFGDFDSSNYVSGNILASISMPAPDPSMKCVESIGSNSVFNNCTFNFVVKK